MRAQESRAGSPRALISPTKTALSLSLLYSPRPPNWSCCRAHWWNLPRLAWRTDLWALTELDKACLLRSLMESSVSSQIALRLRHHLVRTGGGRGIRGETGTETDMSLKRSPNLLALLEPLWSRRPTRSFNKKSIVAHQCAAGSLDDAKWAPWASGLL
eukprot:9270487-Pyramimonas_sp.AAC.1